MVVGASFVYRHESDPQSPVTTAINSTEVGNADPARLVAAGVRGLGVQGIGRIARVAYEFVLSHVFGPAGYGLFAIATSVFDIGRAVAYFGLDHAMVRYVAIYDGQGDLPRVRQVVGLVVSAVCVSALIAATCIAVLRHRIAVTLGAPELERGLLMVALAIVPNAVLIVSAAAVRARGHVALERFLQTVLPPVLLAIVVGGVVGVSKSVQAGFTAFLTCYVASALVGVVVAAKVYHNLRSERPARDRAVRGAVLGFAAPMFFVSFVYILLTEVARLTLAHRVGPSAVGIYTVGTRLATQLTVVYIGFDSLIAPTIARLHHLGHSAVLERGVRRTSYWVTGMTVPLTLVLVVSPGLVTGLFGPGFSGGGGVLAVLALAQLGLVVVGPTGRLLQMTGHATLDLLNTIVAALATAGAAWLLVLPLGALGAAIATGIGVVGLNALQLLEVRVLLRMRPCGMETLGLLFVGAFCWGVSEAITVAAGDGWRGLILGAGAGAAIYMVYLGRQNGIRDFGDLTRLLRGLRDARAPE